jgi:MFS family permease
MESPSQRVRDAAAAARPADALGTPPKVRMTPAERRATSGLAGIFALRMLGMFIVLPVLALYAETLPGGRDHTLVGLALGAYGLTQAILQIPFGWASDRWGRKPVIAAGLAIFAAGSFLAAWAPTVGWTIVGRSLQGAGAISAAVLALTADLTRDAVRTRAMAVIGMTIGATFAVSLIAGPVLGSLVGVPGIFVLTGILALCAIVVLHTSVPQPATARWHSDTGISGAACSPTASCCGSTTASSRCTRRCSRCSSRCRSCCATTACRPTATGRYLPVLLASAVIMWPALAQADRPGRGKPVFVGAVAVLFVG